MEGVALTESTGSVGFIVTESVRVMESGDSIFTMVLNFTESTGVLLSSFASDFFLRNGRRNEMLLSKSLRNSTPTP